MKCVRSAVLILVIKMRLLIYHVRVIMCITLNALKNGYKEAMSAHFVKVMLFKYNITINSNNNIEDKLFFK